MSSREKKPRRKNVSVNLRHDHWFHIFLPPVRSVPPVANDVSAPHSLMVPAMAVSPATSPTASHPLLVPGYPEENQV